MKIPRLVKKTNKRIVIVRHVHSPNVKQTPSLSEWDASKISTLLEELKKSNDAQKNSLTNAREFQGWLAVLAAWIALGYVFMH